MKGREKDKEKIKYICEILNTVENPDAAPAGATTLAIDFRSQDSEVSDQVVAVADFLAVIR